MAIQILDEFHGSFYSTLIADNFFAGLLLLLAQHLILYSQIKKKIFAKNQQTSKKFHCYNPDGLSKLYEKFMFNTATK